MSKVFQMNPFYVVNFKNLMSTFVTHFPRCLTWKSQCGEKRCLFCSLHISMSPENIKENAENVQFNLISGRVQFVQMVAYRLVPDKLPSSLSWRKEGNIVTYNDYCYGGIQKAFLLQQLTYRCTAAVQTLQLPDHQDRFVLFGGAASWFLRKTVKLNLILYKCSRWCK